MKPLKKAILISLYPRYACDMLNGKKPIELRKKIPNWVREEIAKGNAVDFYAYVTKGKPFLAFEEGDYDDMWGSPSTYFEYSIFNSKNDVDESTEYPILNALIPYKFTVRTIDELTYVLGWEGVHAEFYIVDVAKKACVSVDELTKYFNYEKGYAIHVEDLHVFDKPMKLEDFFTADSKLQKEALGGMKIALHPVTRAPQNMQTIYVEVEE